MKDLDFDELDRAVNSLMTNVSDLDTSKPEEKEKTLTIPSSQGNEPADSAVPAPGMPNDAPAKPSEAPATPAVTPATAVPSAPSSKPSLATRRGGRFMDVVHPSSDMKGPTVPARPAVSRQGITIAPSKTPDRPLEKPAEPATPQLSDAKIEPSAVEAGSSAAAPQKAETQERAPASDWPDPLEVADFKDETAEIEAPAKPKAEEPKETMLPAEDEKSQEEPTPLTSPFLSDAKVEKRPLGGGSPEPTDEPDRAPAFGAKADQDLAIADPNAQLPATPSEIETELPEELKSDLVAIEADTTTHQKHDKPEKPAEEAPAQAKTPAEPSPEKPGSAPLITAPSEEKLLAAGPTSIAQQYREEPSTGDQDNGAIYDTDTYHQPLAHPAKKKPSWLWIVWIVLILALGAGAGAGLYLLGIV